MKIIPVNKRLMIEETVPDAVSEGGIILAPSAKEVPTTGILRYAEDESKFKVGQTLIFGKYAGAEIELNRKRYRMLLEEDVFAILEND